MERRHPLNGIYYPYADVQPSRSLLEACLYLDRIYILAPNFFRLPVEGAAIDVPSASSMAPLVSAGLVQPINPKAIGLVPHAYGSAPPLIDEYALAQIRSSITLDLSDEVLSRMTASKGLVSWWVPNGQFIFWNGLGFLLTRPDTAARIYSGRPEYYSHYMPRVGVIAPAVVARSERRIRGNADILQVEVPFLEAESLMLNLVLHASSELGLFPITDDGFHAAFLRRKLERALAQPGMRESLQPLISASREGELGLHTVQLNIPRLRNLDADKVLSLRTSCESSLEAFRFHLRNLSYKLEADPYTASSEEEIRRLISTDIEPALRELRNQLEDKSRGLGVRLIMSAVKSAPLPLLLTLATGLPPAISLASGAAVSTVAEIASYAAERRPLRRNGLYFLLEAKV